MKRALLLLLAVTACATARPEPAGPQIISGSGIATAANSNALVVQGPNVGDNRISPLVVVPALPCWRESGGNIVCAGARAVPDHLHCCGGRDGACVEHSVLFDYVKSGFLEEIDPRIAAMVREKLLDQGDDIYPMPAEGGAR